MASEDHSKDIAYEKFAQEIYQTLLDSEDLKPTQVQHNVELAGRSGCTHQIDVYWEYELAGIIHRVAIECKNYNTSDISIGRIRDFFGALTDIGNISGIFVCKKGYQSGAKKFADFYNINLRELRVPNDKDWEGRVQTIELDICELKTIIKRRTPTIDTSWFASNFPGTPLNTRFQFRGTGKDFLIRDVHGNRITDLYELESNLPYRRNEEWIAETDRIERYEWNDAYVDVEGFGQVKILAFEFVYDVEINKTDEIVISGRDTAKAILKDVKTGTIKFFDKEGNVR